MRRPDKTTTSGSLVNTHSAHSFERSFAEVLGKHVLSAFSLAMASVADDRDRHGALAIVISEDFLKAIGETEEVGVCGQSSLKNARSHGYIFSLVTKRRAVKITLVLMRGEGRPTGILVHSLGFGVRRSLDEITTVLLRRILIDRHSVLEVIFKVGLMRFLKQSSVMLLVKGFLICRLKFDTGALINSTLDSASQTLGGVLCVSLSEGVLTLNSRNESCVARNLLRTNVVEWSVDPSSRVTAQITYSNSGFSVL